MFASEALRNLPAIPKIAQRVTELQPLLTFKPGVAGRTWTGEYTLPNAALQLLLQFARRNGKQQHAHAKPTIGRFLGAEFAVDPSLTPAADDRGRKPRHRHGRLSCP